MLNICVKMASQGALHSGYNHTTTRSWQSTNTEITSKNLLYPLFITWVIRKYKYTKTVRRTVCCVRIGGTVVWERGLVRSPVSAIWYFSSTFFPRPQLFFTTSTFFLDLNFFSRLQLFFTTSTFFHDFNIPT